MSLTPRLPVFRRVRVLVADGDKQLRRRLRQGLESMGLEVTSVSSCAAALKLVTVGQTDLLITDLRLPDRDGRELLEEIRARGRAIPVVLAVGPGIIAGQEAFAVARSAGAQLVMAKPLDMDDFLREVRRLALALSYERLGFLPAGSWKLRDGGRRK